MSTLSILSNQQPKFDFKKMVVIFKKPKIWLGFFAGSILALMIISPIYVHFYEQVEDATKSSLPVITEAPVKTYQDDKVDEDYVERIVDGESKPAQKQEEPSIPIPINASIPSVKKETPSARKNVSSVWHEEAPPSHKEVNTPSPARDYSLGSFVSAVAGSPKTKKYPASLVLHVRLTKPVNSADSQSRVTAVVEDSEGEPFKQAKVIGSISSVRNDTRVSVAFRTLILPSGQEISISAHAQDEAGESGIQGYIKKADFSNTVVNAIGQGAAIFAKEFVGNQIGSNGTQAVDRIVPSSRSSDSTNPVFIDAGGRFQLFFDEGVSL